MLSDTEEEDREQKALFDAMNPEQQVMYRDKNWERVFDISPLNNGWIIRGDWIQATFWEMKKDEIRSVRFFRTVKAKKN